jgi:hypothetical protein
VLSLCVFHSGEIGIVQNIYHMIPYFHSCHRVAVTAYSMESELLVFWEFLVSIQYLNIDLTTCYARSVSLTMVQEA